MKYRTLGQGLEVSAIGIGCMTMVATKTIVYGDTVSEDEATKVVHEAIERGVTFFDTAQIYGPFTNEEFVGRAIKGKRDKLVIATKFGFKFGAKGIEGVDSSPANIRKVCEESLQRLGIETIDLFYQHRVDPDTPIEEVVGTLADLKAEGKIAHLGLSEAGEQTLRRAHAVHPITALQSEYSLWERGVEGGILPACKELGIGFVPYSPLGRGFLTGTIKSRDDIPQDDWRRNDPRWSEENFGANMAIVDAIKQIADVKGASTAQVALAWLLSRGDHVVPIPGVKRMATMRDSVAAAELELSRSELEALEKAVPPGAAQGDRYPERGMRMVRL
jgi:aryl-alcohol dehydrogenase-like predicted oxidoreductase